MGDDDGAPGVDDDGGKVRRAHQMVTGAPSVNVRLGFHAISAHIGSLTALIEARFVRTELIDR